MDIRKISFKTKVIVFVEILVLVINSILAVAISNQLKTQVRETTRAKLISVAANTAALLDWEIHEKIHTEDDRNSSEYEKIQNFLKKIQETDPDINDIYTLRKTEKENVWQFVAAALQTEDRNKDGVIDAEEQGIIIGEEFDVSPYPEMQKSFQTKAADYEITCDKWGCWLSGYAPVLDGTGKAIAVVGVDMSADALRAYEKYTNLTIILTLVVLLFLFPCFLYFFLKRSLQPVSQIVQGIENFSHDLSKRINVKTGDEFEMIASSFNNLGRELQSLYQELEEKVKEKTKRLAGKVAEIKKDKAHDEALLSSVGEALLAVNKKKKIIMANHQAEVLLGKNQKNLIGKEYQEIFRLKNEKGALIGEQNCPVVISLEKGEKTNLAAYLYKKNKQLPVTITSSPIILKGKNLGAMVVFRDITQEKEIDRAKTEFVSLASHQLRTPLASMNWYLELVRGELVGKLNKEQKLYLERIRRSNARLIELVDALLNVSRLDLGTFVIKNQKVDLKEVLKNVLVELKPLLDEKELKLIEKYDAKLPLVKADPQLLQIIFQNLLSNAIKYTPPKGQIKIKFALTAEKRIQMEFADNGYGIPEKQQEKIFTKLFRADNILNKDTGGTGLGLYLVKSIVDASGGVISFRSKEDRGTIFSISYPLSGMLERKGRKK